MYKNKFVLKSTSNYLSIKCNKINLLKVLNLLFINLVTNYEILKTSSSIPLHTNTILTLILTLSNYKILKTIRSITLCTNTILTLALTSGMNPVIRRIFRTSFNTNVKSKYSNEATKENISKNKEENIACINNEFHNEYKKYAKIDKCKVTLIGCNNATYILMLQIHINKVKTTF